MFSLTAMALLLLAVAYCACYAWLHATQRAREPQLLSTKLPFLDPVIGIARYKRFYIVNAPQLIQTIQAKANSSIFVPTLLDFGMLFSGLNWESQDVLRGAFARKGNVFATSVHEYLGGLSTLQAATRAAIHKLSTSVPDTLSGSDPVGLFETIRHSLTLALTGAVYGPENPYEKAGIESSWQEFVPGINHLLYSPFPWLTARKALRARARIIAAFLGYFENGGHRQAFPMIPTMFEKNKSYGLTPGEAAKMEMATSLAMLSSGAITAFWLMLHIISDATALHACRTELLDLVVTNKGEESIKVVDLSLTRAKCPTLLAFFHETLRHHSTVISIKKIQHDTTLTFSSSHSQSQQLYHLKKDAILMIPGTAVHHDPGVWGLRATTFDHQRFLAPDGGQKKLLSYTSAYRPFGAGATMCPGRHFSTATILSLAAMVLLRFDFEPVGAEGESGWRMPATENADLWNAMPKPDWDVLVRVRPKKGDENVEWRFVWGKGEISDKT